MIQAMQPVIDNLIAILKESVKIFTYESLNNIVRFINGVSGLLLAILPGKANILEGLQGWELKPTFCGPILPRWMGNGVSSFNQLIHELSLESDTSSLGYSSEEEDSDGYLSAESTKSENPRISFLSNMNEYERPWASIGKLQTLRDHFVQRATDRRRGVIEDLHLATEIFIETIFDVVHKTAHFLLSPSKAFEVLFPWAFEEYNGRYNNSHTDDYVETTVQTTTLREGEPLPNERKATLHPLNTDARTCQDVITELGYPYEAIRVITDDGYILLLERIPRRDSRRAVYLQHGVLDSSMGWVSNGVVGSPAFAAFDQGYDVFLGNFRGLVSREHVDRNISSKQYWRYSINEHGTMDISAMVDKIHKVKTTELKLRYPDLDLDLDKQSSDEPVYNLCAICHSLAGAAVLIYLITRRLQQKPHRLSRLILLSPAGFHNDTTLAFTAVGYTLLVLAPIMEKFVPAFYIPTRFFRMLLNKLARDFHNYPAIGGLVQTLASYIAGGDSSNWIGVLGLPHYNMNDMPGVSFYVALHLAQMKRSGKFRMFDYGSVDANVGVYGCPEPLDLGRCYDLIDIPVDLVGGRKDKIIRPTMVWKHYCVMMEAGVEASYNEYEYAHLDFTFSHREELLAFVMSRLSVPKSKGRSYG